MSKMPNIKQVIYSDPVTIIIWEDGTKTLSRCDDDDVYDELTGFMLCIFKKVLTPKTMRKMFKNYVYNIDSDKIKWQSKPTWLEEDWLDVALDNCRDNKSEWGFELNVDADKVDKIVKAFFGDVDRSIYVL